MRGREGGRVGKEGETDKLTKSRSDGEGEVGNVRGWMANGAQFPIQHSHHTRLNTDISTLES